MTQKDRGQRIRDKHRRMREKGKGRRERRQGGDPALPSGPFESGCILEEFKKATQ